MYTVRIPTAVGPGQIERTAGQLSMAGNQVQVVAVKSIAGGLAPSSAGHGDTAITTSALDTTERMQFHADTCGPIRPQSR